MLCSSRVVEDVEEWQLKCREQYEEKHKSLTIWGAPGDLSPTTQLSVKPIHQTL